MGEDTKRGGMPLVVCQVGSGVGAIATMGAGAGVIGGVAYFAHRRDELRAEERRQERWREYERTGTWPDDPAPPAWFAYALVIFFAAILIGIWWQIREGLYAHCLRYWHPEIAPPKKVACPECQGCELCNGTRQVDEGATLPDEPDTLWVDATGAVWCGPVTHEGSNFRYLKLSGFEGAEGGGLRPSWILARSDADPTWLPFDYGVDDA